MEEFLWLKNIEREEKFIKFIDRNRRIKKVYSTPQSDVELSEIVSTSFGSKQKYDCYSQVEHKII